MESTYGSLYLPYKDQYWFWECVEMWRKMILTGGMVLVAPGSSAQVLWAEVVCLIYLLLVLKIAPFRYDLDDWLAFAASLQLFLVFMAAFALKTDDPNDTVYEKKTMGICLAILCCGVVLLGCCVLGSLVYTYYKGSDDSTTGSRVKVKPVSSRGKKDTTTSRNNNKNKKAKGKSTNINNSKTKIKSGKQRGSNNNNSKGGKASRFWQQQK